MDYARGNRTAGFPGLPGLYELRRARSRQASLEPGRGHSRPLIQHALDSGITFVDTANVYSDGTSKEIVGRALAEYATGTRSCWPPSSTN